MASAIPKLSGVKQVELSNDNGSTWEEFTEVSQDSSDDSESSTQELSSGLPHFAGDDVNLTFQFWEVSKYSTLRGWFKNNDTVQVKLTYMDGTVETIENDSSSAIEMGIQDVSKQRNFTPREFNTLQVTLQYFGADVA